MKRFLFIVLIFLCGCRSYFSVFERNEISKPYLVLLHNKERCLREFEQLSFDSDLSNFAQKHADWMCKNNAMIHSKKLPSGYKYIAENIARGQQTESSVISDWMNSKGHKDNILGKQYKKVGIGYADYKGTPYWCVIFSN